MDYTGVSGGGRGRGCNTLFNLPSPKALKSHVVSMITLILQPSRFIVPFFAFQLLEIYWKNEHRLMCTGEICTASERDCYEKPIYEVQRNAVLCVSACLLITCGVSAESASITVRFRAGKKLRKRYKDQ